MLEDKYAPAPTKQSVYTADAHTHEFARSA